MFSKLTLLATIVLAVIVMNAQDKLPELQKAQKALKNSLIKYAPYVSSVKFEQCRVLITLSSPGVGTFLGNGGSSSGGGFPTDDASVYLSSGSKAEYLRVDEFEHYVLNLEQLNPKNITLISPYRKDISRVDLTDSRGKNAIGIRRKDKIDATFVFTFFVKEKNADETVKAMQEAIDQCSALKH